MRQKKCLPDEQYGKLSRRVKELMRRIDEGTLDFDLAMTNIQQLIEMRASSFFELRELSALIEISVDYDRSPKDEPKIHDFMIKTLCQPLDPELELSRTGKANVHMQLVEPKDIVHGSREQIALGFLKYGRRCANIQELLAFRRASSVAQIRKLTNGRSGDIIALGSLFFEGLRKVQDHVVPVLEQHGQDPFTSDDVAVLNRISMANLHGIYLVVIE